jgi:C4-dicarboxylate-specific signal transduction histidine kinase
MLNLLHNALQAIEESRRGAGQIVIHAARTHEGIEVRVRDSGVGLPPASSNRVFEPYFTTKANGLGMGLCISRSIVEAHGGHLDVEPCDSGATFVVSLPVA